MTLIPKTFYDILVKLEDGTSFCDNYEKSDMISDLYDYVRYLLGKKGK